MTINTEILKTIEHFRNELPAEMNSLIEQGADEITALDIIGNAINAGDQAPNFQLHDQNGDLKLLSEYLKEGPLVVTFYRGVWCPYCNIQLKAYSNRLDEIHAAGAKLVAITPEKPGVYDILQNSSTPEEMYAGAITDTEFDVLYDADSKVTSSYGLEFKLPDSHIELLSLLQINIEELTGSEKYIVPDPATYIINQNGSVQWAFIPNNYRKRAEVDDILTALAN